MTRCHPVCRELGGVRSEKIISRENAIVESHNISLHLILGYRPDNNLLFLLLGLIPHIVPGVGFLEPLNPGLGELKHTVTGPTQLSVDRSLWNHIQIKHMEADDTQNAVGPG